ncbi:hypothetical protein Nmel_001584, partial [Mimus melanotis]
MKGEAQLKKTAPKKLHPALSFSKCTSRCACHCPATVRLKVQPWSYWGVREHQWTGNGTVPSSD